MTLNPETNARPALGQETSMRVGAGDRERSQSLTAALLIATREQRPYAAQVERLIKGIDEHPVYKAMDSALAFIDKATDQNSQTNQSLPSWYSECVAGIAGQLRTLTLGDGDLLTLHSVDSSGSQDFAAAKLIDELREAGVLRAAVGGNAAEDRSIISAAANSCIDFVIANSPQAVEKFPRQSAIIADHLFSAVMLGAINHLTGLKLNQLTDYVGPLAESFVHIQSAALLEIVHAIEKRSTSYDPARGLDSTKWLPEGWDKSLHLADLSTIAQVLVMSYVDRLPRLSEAVDGIEAQRAAITWTEQLYPVANAASSGSFSATSPTSLTAKELNCAELDTTVVYLGHKRVCSAAFFPSTALGSVTYRDRAVDGDSNSLTPSSRFDSTQDAMVRMHTDDGTVGLSSTSRAWFNQHDQVWILHDHRLASQDCLASEAGEHILGLAHRAAQDVSVLRNDYPSLLTKDCLIGPVYVIREQGRRTLLCQACKLDKVEQFSLKALDPLALRSLVDRAGLPSAGIEWQGYSLPDTVRSLRGPSEVTRAETPLAQLFSYFERHGHPTFGEFVLMLRPFGVWEEPAEGKGSHGALFRETSVGRFRATTCSTTRPGSDALEFRFVKGFLKSLKIDPIELVESLLGWRAVRGGGTDQIRRV